MRFSNIPMLVVVLGLTVHGVAEARVYRCTDAQGKVSYSQSPCPASQKSDQMRGVSSAPRQDRDLCLLARDLATQVFAEITEGVEPGAVIDQYGGVNYVNAPTLSVINFAASLRYNDALTPLRVGSLSFSRCLEGGFGKLKPGDLPEPEPEESVSTPQERTGIAPLQAAGDSAAGLQAGGSGSSCASYRQQLATLDAQLLRKNNARQNDALSEERAQYQALLAECEE